jgi:hypothetical protein
MKTSLRSVLALSLLTLSGPVLAHSRPSPIAPGEYRNWGGSIDKLEIVSPFRLSSYHQVLVAPLDTSPVRLPDAGDASYRPFREILSQATSAFVFGIKEILPKVPAQVAGPEASPGPGTLVVHCKLTELNPGSQAPRYSSTDPSRASATMEGEVVDGGTGKTLFRFRQERRFSSQAEMDFSRHTPQAPLQGHIRVVLQPLPAEQAYKRDMGLNIRFIGQDVGDILRSF